MLVTLTNTELMLYAQLGVLRRVRSIRRPERANPNGSAQDPGWNRDIEGACGEGATAKGLGVYFEPTEGTFEAGGDVLDLQVRTSVKPSLMVRAHDVETKPDTPFVCAHGKAPTYNIVGWIWAREAPEIVPASSSPDWPPAHFVPLDRLRPLDTLYIGGEPVVDLEATA